MKSKLILAIICWLTMGLYACSTEDQKSEKSQNKSANNPSIVIMTHDSFSVSKEVAAKFEEKLEAKLVILKSGDAGEALNKAILSKNNPLADIFYGVDNTFLTRALKAA